jgi:FG-GAP-like repeat
VRHLTLSLLCISVWAATSNAQLPKFRMQEIDRGLKIGYAVIVEDLDGDDGPDIVVVDQHQISWYRNPGSAGSEWEKHLILDGQTRADNVCITAIDIVGDKLPELVVGAGWKPFDTLNAGQLLWLERSEKVTDPWIMHELPCDEPTVHRVRAIDIDNDGIQEIVHVPLMGRDATKDANWVNGRPLSVIALRVPEKQPRDKSNWQPQVLAQELHVAHNFAPGRSTGFARTGQSILIASFEGVSEIYPAGTELKWATKLLHPANQTNPQSNRGASEIKRSLDGRGVIATIEPWHGNQVVVYSPGQQDDADGFSLNRQVIDQELRWGHAVSFADLDGDRVDELIIGVRDDPIPDQGDKFTQRRGVRVYQASNESESGWSRTIIDNGGVAVEDLTVADLNGDGRIDLVAVGRQTGNTRIYWNEGPRKN